MHEKLLNGEATMSVVGLGYVGLPIALAFAKHIKVIGFDINEERVEMMRNRIDNTFDANHALRPSKPPKGCVGLGIGATPMRNNPHITDMISVIGMTHGTRGNRL